MTSKMAARVLQYKLGSPSYGDSKLEKLKKLQEEDRLAIFKPGLWQTGFSDAAKNGLNGTIFSRN